MNVLDSPRVRVTKWNSDGSPTRIALRECPACGQALWCGEIPGEDPDPDRKLLPAHLFNDHVPEDFGLSPIGVNPESVREKIPVVTDGGDRS